MNTRSNTAESSARETRFDIFSGQSSIDIEAIGKHVIRYGLAVVILWIGFMKFTAYEAGAIKGFVQNSPFLGWLYSASGDRGVSAVFGVAEIAIGLLLVARPFSPRAAVFGGVGAVLMFLTTLTFIATTPGVGEPTAGGFPALSVPGQFLLKDIVLLGSSLWCLGESLRALRESKTDG